MTELEALENSWGFVADMPMMGERLWPRCRICGRKVRSKKALYHGHCTCCDGTREKVLVEVLLCESKKP